MKKYFIAAICLVFCILSWFPISASAVEPCLSTARNMYQACRIDIREEVNVLKANCQNILDQKTRRKCFFKDTKTLRKEESAMCSAQRTARVNACRELGEKRFADPLLDASTQFIDPDDIPAIHPVNPYVSLQAGHTFVLKSGDNSELVVVNVTNRSREILGVACRVVTDIVLDIEEENGEIEYSPVEVTDDWFAQDTDSNVYYCGEDVRDFEDDVLISIDGSFEAGKDFSKSGFLIKALPTAGETHRQEYALGEAEDIVTYISLSSGPDAEEGGDNSLFPCNGNQCLKTFDFAPLDPASTENKYYLPGIGFVLAVGLENGELTGERKELVCVGDSLDIIKDPSCGINNPAELLDKLCKLSPDTFCEDE